MMWNISLPRGMLRRLKLQQAPSNYWGVGEPAGWYQKCNSTHTGRRRGGSAAQ